MENYDKETTRFREYQIADISSNDLKMITDLEQRISNDTKEDIVLIAYHHSHTK